MVMIAMMVCSAIVNRLAFSGSYFLFACMIKSNAAEIWAKRERHNEALEKLQVQAAQAEWAKQRMQRLHWINNELQRQNHVVQIFRDVDEAMHEYNKTRNWSQTNTPNKYTLSDGQKGRDMTIVL